MNSTIVREKANKYDILTAVNGGAHRFASQVIKVFKAYKMRRRWNHLAIHRSSLTERLPQAISIPLLCGPVKGKLRCPTNLTIVLIHDYVDDPIMVRALRYVGIDEFVIKRPPIGRLRCGSHKLTVMHQFLRDECDTDYVMYFDSCDVVLRDDPAKAIEYLRQYDADLLFSNTRFSGGYSWMPDKREWADGIARDQGQDGWYLNAGVFIGKSAFTLEVIEACLPYVTDTDLRREDYMPLLHDPNPREDLPNFPRGIGSDQVLLRYVHPDFYPRMQIDYQGLLALR